MKTKIENGKLSVDVLSLSDEAQIFMCAIFQGCLNFQEHGATKVQFIEEMANLWDVVEWNGREAILESIDKMATAGLLRKLAELQGKGE